MLVSLQVLPGIFLPEHCQRRAHLLLLFIQCIFQADPEQSLIQLLVFSTQLIKKCIQLLLLAPFVRQPDDQIQIQICRSIR